MSATPFDHPFLGGLFGDTEVAAALDVDRDIEAMLRFEAALAEEQAKVGLISRASAQDIAIVCASLQPDIAKLRLAVERDGVVVPELIAQLRSLIAGSAAQDLHFGATSQDVIDTSFSIRLSAVLAIFEARLKGVLSALASLSARFGDQPLMAQTRMQHALSITAADRIARWQAPLNALSTQLHDVRAKACCVQLAGPVGDNRALGDHAKTVITGVAKTLELSVPRDQWHTNRSSFMDFAMWATKVTAATGKIAQDIVLMAQNDVAEIILETTGGSSAMPHKRNPIKAEIVIALHRSNSAHLSALANAGLHELERSGAAWSLEWLALPQMCVATGACLRNTEELLSAVSHLGRS